MSPDGGFKKGGTEPASRHLPGEVLGLGLNVVVSAFFFAFLGRWVGSKIGGQEYLTLLGGFSSSWERSSVQPRASTVSTHT